MNIKKTARKDSFLKKLAVLEEAYGMSANDRDDIQKQVNEELAEIESVYCGRDAIYRSIGEPINGRIVGISGINIRNSQPVFVFEYKETREDLVPSAKNKIHTMHVNLCDLTKIDGIK